MAGSDCGVCMMGYSPGSGSDCGICMAGLYRHVGSVWHGMAGLVCKICIGQD